MGIQKAIKIELFGVEGKLIHSDTRIKKTFNLNVSPGVYILKIDLENRIVKTKLMIN